MDLAARAALVGAYRTEIKQARASSAGIPKPPKKGYAKLPKNMRPEERQARLAIAKRTADALGVSVDKLDGSPALYGPAKGKFAKGARTQPSWNPRTGEYLRGPKKGAKSPRINLRTGKTSGGKAPPKPVRFSSTTGGWTRRGK